MKMNRKAAAFITAGLMAISLCVPASMTAYAGTITIGTVNNDVERQYKAYPIITGTFAADGETLTNPQWGADIDSAKLIAALKKNASTLGITLGETPTIEDVVTALGGMTDAKKIEKLAKILDDIEIIPATASAIELEENAAGNYATGNITNGWYLIKDGSTLTGNDVQSANLLQLTKVDGDEVINPKYSLPTLDKKIVKGEDRVTANTASIGDKIPYELTSAVPNMTGYDKYFFVVNDDLATGLTFNDDVVVSVNNVEIAKTLYTVQTNPEDTDGHSFQIVFNDFYGNFKDKAGKDIKITYSATLNEGADITVNGNENTASLTYSNNPNVTPTGVNEPEGTDPKGTTPPKNTKTYTANLKLMKVDEEGNELKGAKFQISGDAVNAVLINEKAYEKYTGTDTEGIFYMLKDGSFTPDAPTAANKNLYDNDGNDKYKKVTKVTKDTQKATICREAYVDEDGILVFNGLGAGTYTITELIAPDGYNKLEQPITFTLSDNARLEAAEGVEAGPNWSVSGGGAAMDTTDNVTVNLTIENKAGSILPSTGGIGTKLFFVFGAALAIGSGIYLVTKKRMAGVEE